MKSLSEILLKHPVPGLRQSERRKVCAEVLTKFIGLPIKASQVNWEDEILSLSVSPVIKSEILMHETELHQLLASGGITVKKMR